jgi:DNA-directed RNA polymerase subunit RPC12/RpoP
MTPDTRIRCPECESATVEARLLGVIGLAENLGLSCSECGETLAKVRVRDADNRLWGQFEAMRDD